MNRVNQEYWDNSYKNISMDYRSERVKFKDLFEKYLPHNGSCFEVGCYPGDYSIYLGKQFNYTVGGIDTTPYVLTKLPEKVEINGVNKSQFFLGDFLKFQSSEHFDVVCSFGFIEHFDNWQEAMEAHIRLLKPNGYLVISVPNFAGIQFILHYLLDKQNLQRHVIGCMNLNKWKKILSANEMELLFHNYYQTVDFWIDNPDATKFQKIMAKRLTRIMRTINNKINMPNSLLSPHIISISRKK